MQGELFVCTLQFWSQQSLNFNDCPRDYVYPWERRFGATRIPHELYAGTINRAVYSKEGPYPLCGHRKHVVYIFTQHTTLPWHHSLSDVVIGVQSVRQTWAKLAKRKGFTLNPVIVTNTFYQLLLNTVYFWMWPHCADSIFPLFSFLGSVLCRHANNTENWGYDCYPKQKKNNHYSSQPISLMSTE